MRVEVGPGAERRKDEERDAVEQEDNGERNRGFLGLRTDGGCGGGDRAAATDAGAGADERGDLGCDAEPAGEPRAEGKRGDKAGERVAEAVAADAGDDGEVDSGAEADDGTAATSAPASASSCWRP